MSYSYIVTHLAKKTYNRLTNERTPLDMNSDGHTTFQRGIETQVLSCAMEGGRVVLTIKPPTENQQMKCRRIDLSDSYE